MPGMITINGSETSSFPMFNVAVYLSYRNFKAASDFFVKHGSRQHLTDSSFDLTFRELANKLMYTVKKENKKFLSF